MLSMHGMTDITHLARTVAALGLPAPWVVALPMEAMPMAAEIAHLLRAPLDMLLVRDVEAQTFDRAAPQPVLLLGRSVVLVDDGTATRDRLLAAVRALRGLKPYRIVLVSLAASHTMDATLHTELDHLICPPPASGDSLACESVMPGVLAMGLSTCRALCTMT